MRILYNVAIFINCINGLHTVNYDKNDRFKRECRITFIETVNCHFFI